MTGLERRVLKTGSLAGLCGFVLCTGGAYVLEFRPLASVANGFGFVGGASAFLWFVQASRESLRDDGLGEGVANLYGEKTAKLMFGEEYKKPKDD